MLEELAILKNAGADLSHVAVSHIDGFGFSLETRLKALKEGCYLEYDGFGQALFHFFHIGRIANTLSDLHKVVDIMELIEKGYLNQIPWHRISASNATWRLTAATGTLISLGTYSLS